MTTGSILRGERTRSEQNVDFAAGEVGAHQLVQAIAGLTACVVRRCAFGDRVPGNDRGLKDSTRLARSHHTGESGHDDGECGCA